MKFLIFIFSLSSLYSLPFYNASEFIEYLRNATPANETLLKNAIDNTIEFLKHHVYYTVSSDPPQPDFDKSYFEKKEILNLFKDITIKDTNYFDFKNEFFSAVYQLNDLHTLPYLGLFPIENYVYIAPISLITRYNSETNKTKMYGNLAIQPENYNLFKNGDTVVKVIKDNLNTAIESINEKDPFTFIQEFAGLKLKNKHSTYVFKQAIYTKNNFYIPVTLKELANFTVLYESGQSFTTDYIIFIQDTNNNLDNVMFYEKKEDNEKFLSYLSKNNNKVNSIFSKETPETIFGQFPFKNLDDLILEFEERYKVQSNNIFLTPYKTKIKNNVIEWEYSYNSTDINIIVFQCRVDEEKHVNVMKINNFGGTSDSEASLDVAAQCAYLFDKNDYRIIIIFPRNGGGNPIIGYNIIELLSPYILTRNALRIKKDKNIDIFIEEYNNYNLFDEINSTNKVNGDYIKDGFVSEKYGTKTEEFSKPFAWRVNQKKIEKIKSKLKHKRTPTEIIVMTDGFALSAASIFMKNVYKSGAGIVIGYNGNPCLPENVFDISQSPSAVLGIERYKNIFPEILEKTIEYKIGLASLTCISSYHEFQESHIPQEYDVQIPDKRIKIYHEYDDTFYQEFINESIEVLDSYKENCNPNHKMLVLFSDECKFDNHLHGGYACGSDFKWNKSNCIPVYCDGGYYYNKISNSCIKYPMENNKEEEIDDNDFVWILIVIIICVIVILIVLTLILLYRGKSLCF